VLKETVQDANDFLDGSIQATRLYERTIAPQTILVPYRSNTKGFVAKDINKTSDVSEPRTLEYRKIYPESIQ